MATWTGKNTKDRWREKGAEMDYVAVMGRQIVGIEVKSGDDGISKKAAESFMERFPKAKLLPVGKNGIPYETFMKTELSDLVLAANHP